MFSGGMIMQHALCLHDSLHADAMAPRTKLSSLLAWMKIFQRYCATVDIENELLLIHIRWHRW